MYVCLYYVCMYLYIYIYIYIYIYTYIGDLELPPGAHAAGPARGRHLRLSGISLSLYLSLYIYIYIYLFIHISIYLSLLLSLSIHIYIYIYMYKVAHLAACGTTVEVVALGDGASNLHPAGPRGAVASVLTLAPSRASVVRHMHRHLDACMPAWLRLPQSLDSADLAQRREVQACSCVSAGSAAVYL